MGVTKLLSFAREAVPNGSFTIDIKEEIRKFYSSSTSTNPPAPIIVVDLMCIVRPFIMLDAVGVLCGGRYNHISRQLDAFFGEMKNLGAELAFFWDGPITMTTDDGWCKKRDHKYQTVIELFDAVDQGFDIFDPNPDIIPFHYTATVKQVAMRHGRYYYATSRECDQDMVAFANNSRALAIITNDSDMLIYGGSWRFWCTNGLNMANLTIVEYDRVALRSFLQLSTAQMSLMATLVGNDIINSSELYNFHKVLGRSIDKITNVADFILTNANKSADGILIEALEFCSNRRALMKRFKMSLAIYNLVLVGKHTTNAHRHQLKIAYEPRRSKSVVECPRQELTGAKKRRRTSLDDEDEFQGFADDRYESSQPWKKKIRTREISPIITRSKNVHIN
ncbi:constitutive coactivator of peroxisome proliferator-activated receptor gamma isoform X2 [Armigeres subalbatus]|uniref:constitutive coactivator of peroxisome proliferator-activated receptor gamma isoform X2 n=1 Tax=Armigeres subalbatus TaxID=124917 RepID=UPI002ED067F9